MAAAQIYISQAVGYEHRLHRAGVSVAYGLLGLIALFAFVVADWRLLRRLSPAMGGSSDAPASEIGYRTLEADRRIRTNLAWNIVCAVLALGCVLWVLFHGTGTYGLS